MKETTILNRIERLTESIDYEKIYIDIQTANDRYTIEKSKKRGTLGFKTE